MSKSLRIYIQCASLVLILFCAFGTLYVEEKRMESKTLAIKDLSQRIQELTASSEKILDVEDEIKKVQGERKKFSEKFLLQGEMPKLIQSLSSLLSASHLRVMSILPKVVPKQEGSDLSVSKSTLMVEVQGEYRDFGDWLHQLESDPKAITLDEIEMVHKSPGSDQLNIKIVLSVFLKNTESPEKKLQEV